MTEPRSTEDPLVVLEGQMLALETFIDDSAVELPEDVHKTWHRLQDQVRELPARSIAGLAVKLRYMRANRDYLCSNHRDFNERLFESAIESAERLAAGVGS